MQDIGKPRRLVPGFQFLSGFEVQSPGGELSKKLLLHSRWNKLPKLAPQGAKFISVPLRSHAEIPHTSP